MPSDDKISLIPQFAVLEALLEELIEEQGPDYTQWLLLGEADPLPDDTLCRFGDAKRDLVDREW